MMAIVTDRHTGLILAQFLLSVDLVIDENGPHIPFQNGCVSFRSIFKSSLFYVEVSPSFCVEVTPKSLVILR